MLNRARTRWRTRDTHFSETEHDRQKRGKKEHYITARQPYHVPLNKPYYESLHSIHSHNSYHFKTIRVHCNEPLMKVALFVKRTENDANDLCGDLGETHVSTKAHWPPPHRHHHTNAAASSRISTTSQPHTFVIEPWRNLSFSVGHCQDFITIGTNVRKAIIPLP